MNQTHAVVTVVTPSHLPYALAMAESCRAVDSQLDVYVCVIDRRPLSEEVERCVREVGCHLLTAQHLAIADWDRFSFQYTPFELSCALKPALIQCLFDRGVQRVVYLDADMQVYEPMRELFQLLESYPLVLTPHLLRDLPADGAQPQSHDFLRSGAFNAGCVAVANMDIGRAFLAWWSQRLEHECYVDMDSGIFVDQKWLDLVPSLFPQAHILRHSGYNVGHWSLPQYELSQRHEDVWCGEAPLVLMHFSHLTDPHHDEFHRIQSRWQLSQLPILERLVTEYQARVEAFRQKLPAAQSSFHQTDSGQVIRSAWREAVRRGHPSIAEVADPFSALDDAAIRSRFTQLEGQAHRWRRDWRDAGPPDTRRVSVLKRLKKNVRACVRQVESYCRRAA